MRLSVVAGSFAKLDSLAKDLGERRASLFLFGLAHNLSQESLSLVKEGFRTSSGPDGRPWPGKRKGQGKPGIETGHLASSWYAHATEKTAEVYSTSPYARPLHYGTAHIKPHPMIPTKRLPARWRDRLTAVFWRHVQRWIGGRI